MAIITFFIFLYLLQINLQWYNLFRFSEIYVSLSKRVQENIITIGELSETHRRPIRDPSETHRRPIGDQHSWSETHWRPSFLIVDPSETDMPDRRHIGDQHAWSETHRRPTCLIRDPWKTDMPHRRPIGDQPASSEADMPHQRLTQGKICIYYGSHMRHVGLRWGMVRRSLMGLRCGMLVSN